MKNSISLRWSDTIDEGVIKTLIEWNKLSSIIKIDALDDWIFELNKLKDAVYKDEWENT
jgi:hypothetical protein